MITLENKLMLIFWHWPIFYWCVDGIALGQNVLNSNWKFDLVAMATAVYATIPSKMWPNLTAMDFGNTKIYRFLHPFLYLFSYSWLTISIFGNHKPELQTALITWVISLWYRPVSRASQPINGEPGQKSPLSSKVREDAHQPHAITNCWA